MELRPPGDLVDPSWAAEALSHNGFNGATGGIWRVERDGGPAVLKLSTPPGRDGVPAHWATSEDPGHWNYWRRESLAYTEGLAAAFAGAGIRAPRLREVVRRSDGSTAIWLEWVAGTPGPAATPADLGELAERLGAAHAAWLGRRPDVPWLSRDWLRDYTLSRKVPARAPWEHPDAAWPAALRADLRDLWERRHDVLRATDDLPATLCHHDVWPMNLVVTPTGPVLLDWSFIGPGPIGEDAANLILDTFFDGFVDLAHLDDVVELVSAGYVRGLDGAVDATTARRGIGLCGAAKYFWLAPMMLAALETRPKTTGQYDTRGVEEMFAGRRPILEVVAAWYRKWC
ncbi:hypothetical protein Val02_00250 [Virgisporangium aliadipatigenens]|uniref:Aminoglycoside phosphotransferase n=1 Tax=Virgisporangium aliadipatigenens TaxID=741659 RepID=A0A8J3YDI8_9ACTN|nr:phosphotransferase [Virgisporangium aliadipatigenens]GIJ43139.1 hypothetical protein Val02_00250 [Virgisporangium aliadipatigenens]